MGADDMTGPPGRAGGEGPPAEAAEDARAESATPAESGAGPADPADVPGQLRLLEALLFAAAEPLDEATLAERLPDGADVPALLDELARLYANRGVRLVRVGARWAMRTAPDLAPYLRVEKPVARRLRPAAVETLAVIAYHQPVTRAEIEEIRGKSLSRGTLDVLLEAGWIRPKGRRRTPGRPATWGTTEAFLDHFGLESLDDLPGVEELKAAGLLDARPAITAYGALAESGKAPAAPGAEEPDAAGDDDEAAADEAENEDDGGGPEAAPAAPDDDTGDDDTGDDASGDDDTGRG